MFLEPPGADWSVLPGEWLAEDKADQGKAEPRDSPGEIICVQVGLDAKSTSVKFIFTAPQANNTFPNVRDLQFELNFFAACYQKRRKHHRVATLHLTMSSRASD